MSECKDCGKEEVKHICPKCGKEYKTKRWLDQHLKGCVEVEEVIELNVVNEIIEELDDDNIDVSNIIVEEPKVERDIITNTKQEVKTWMNNLNGRMSANKMELEQMFAWFKILYPKSKINFDYTCPSCVQHCFKRLKEII